MLFHNCSAGRSRGVLLLLLAGGSRGVHLLLLAGGSYGVLLLLLAIVWIGRRQLWCTVYSIYAVGRQQL